MTRKTSNDFHPEVLKLFDKYVHGDISRRGFLQSTATFAIGTTAVDLLDALNPRFAAAQKIAEDDPRIRTEYAEYPSPPGSGKLRGYLVHPATASGKLPTVLVVHENRGLNPHIEDIARRLALDNFIVFAPDALFPLGGYPGNEDKARELFAKLDQTRTREDFIAAADILKVLPEGNGKVGVVGFCYGGGHCQLPCDTITLSGGGRTVLWRTARGGRSGENQGSAAAALRRERRAHQRRLASI